MRVRITLAAVAVTAVAVGTAGWLLVRSVEDAQIGDIRHQLEAYLDDMVSRLQAGEDPQWLLRPEQDRPGIGFVRVTNEAGDLVAQSEPMTGDPEGDGDGNLDDSEAVVPHDGSPPEGWVVASPNETIERRVATPSGELTVTVTAPVDQVSRNVEDLTARLVIGLPVLVALVGVIAWVLVGRALRPVEAIRAEVERISGSTMHRRVPVPDSGDEVGRLAGTMNTMLARLEASATRQRRFVSDASHELRSPVAVIRAGLEVAHNKADPKGRPIIDTLLAEESRLETLLDDLLLLAAHDENGASPPPAVPVNLTELAVGETRRPRRVPVRLASPTDDRAVVVAGVHDQLARALGNLVDNAARHATSVVQIRALLDNGTARLLVDDDGPGIMPDDRERVFERFTRLDTGRSRQDGGSGLGLAVVRAIVTFHHGVIRVDDSPLGGARFVTDLPSSRGT